VIEFSRFVEVLRTRGLIRAEHVAPVESLIVLGLALYPIFVLTVGRWVSGWHFVLAFAATAVLYARRDDLTLNTARKQSNALVIALASSMVAIAVSQLLQHDFDVKRYASPLRLLLGVPVFLVVMKLRIDGGRLLHLACPVAVLLTLVSVLVFPFSWEGRMATYFVDPLTFGSLSLLLGLLSLISLNLYGRDELPIWILKLAAFAAGVYLSIQSQSRTGWLALPVLLAIWLISSRAKARAATLGASLLVAVAIALAAYLGSEIVQKRVDLALEEAASYSLVNPNPDNSLSMRISMWRIGLYLFSLRPLAGWGDSSFAHVLDDPQIAPYATEFTRRFALNHGFHNEFVTNAVRAGVFGVVATLLLFAVPGWIFAKELRSNRQSVRGASLLGLCFVVGEFICGMTVEVVNLKFTASFYAMLVASLCGTVLQEAAANSSQGQA
jgi:O-antigen ligase